LPTSADTLLLDTSAALALINPEHPAHTAVAEATAGRRLGLAGHAVFETLSAGTRLPPPNRLSGADALRLIEENFPDSRFLSAQAAADALRRFVAKGVVGGAVWDGLVAATAREHNLTLLTCDRRAQPTYEAVGAAYTLVTSYPHLHAVADHCDANQQVVRPAAPDTSKRLDSELSGQ
jgi:predicted nucleic acid-binding protein